ncbi:MAG: MoaD/ThiS family protein, partial [Actinobacteria bacterium]|nr:MoaD/ThiS family protein [Actinomycetota bacterium]
MKVRVRLFAALRERAGSRSVEIELPVGAVVGDVWGELAFGDEPEGLLYAVNRDYTEKSAKLSPGDEVAV